MSTEILYKGLSRKVSKKDYSKLRNYNKMGQSRLYTEENSFESPSMRMTQFQEDDFDDIRNKNQSLKRSIETLRQQGAELSRAMKKENRLAKLIDSKIKKVKEKKGVDSFGLFDGRYCIKDLQNFLQIKLELEVAQLEEVLERKSQEYFILTQKRKEKKIKLLNDRDYSLKTQATLIFLQESEAMECHANSLEGKIKKCSEQNRSIQEKLAELKKENKKKAAQLSKILYQYKEAMETLEERQQRIKTKRSEDFVEVKGGQMKNSQCLELQISQNRSQWQRIECQLGQFMQQKIRNKINLNRQIELYTGVVNRQKDSNQLSKPFVR